MAFVIAIDYHKSVNTCLFHWIVNLLLLVRQSVWKAEGHKDGLQRPFRMQPSEFTKLTLILMLARVLARYEEEGINNWKSMAEFCYPPDTPSDNNKSAGFGYIHGADCHFMGMVLLLHQVQIPFIVMASVQPFLLCT